MSDDSADLIPNTNCFKVGLQGALCFLSLGYDLGYVSRLPLINVKAGTNHWVRHLHIALNLRYGNAILLFWLDFALLDQLKLGDLFKDLLHRLQVVFSYGRHLLTGSLCLVRLLLLTERGGSGHHRTSPSIIPGLYLSLELSQLPLFLLPPLLSHH